MSALSIQPTFPIFTETDGLPLENGYIWVGVANLSPQVNPTAVYWDAEQTIAAPQPIRTLNGYPSRNGTPARFYVAGNYSIQVLDAKGSVVYTSLNDNLSGRGFIESSAIGDGVQTIFSASPVPSAIFINGVYQNKNTYSVASGSVTFSEAPPDTSVIEFLV